MNDRRIISYFQVRGWGKVSANDTVGSLISQASANLNDDEMRLGVGNYTLFENWEGATVYVVSGDQSRIETGYYTLLEVDPVSGRITIKGKGITAGYSTAGPFTNWSVRIEDFVKISHAGVPDFVTGSKAIANWASLVLGVTNTISQKIEPIGGVATVDGFTIRCMYKTGNELIEKLLSRYPTPVLDVTGTALYTTQDDTILANTNLDLSAEPDAEFIATDPLYNGWANMLNGEAVCMTAWNAGNSTVDVIRGILNTKVVWQSYATLFAEQIGQSQGALLEFYQIPSWARGFDNTYLVFGDDDTLIKGAESLYFGLIDNINMDDGLTEFDLEVSSVLLKPRLATISYGITEVPKNSAARYYVPALDPDVNILRDIQELTDKPTIKIDIKQRFKTKNWSWLSMGPVALRIGCNQFTEATNLEANPVITDPSWRVSYPIADLMLYSNTGNLEYEPYYYENFTGLVVLDSMNYDRYDRTCLVPGTDEAANKPQYWLYNTQKAPTYDPVDERRERISMINFASSDVVGITQPDDADRESDISDMAPALVHVFEQGGGQTYGMDPAVMKAASDNWPMPDGYTPPSFLATDYEDTGRGKYVYIPVIDVRDLILQLLTSMSGKLSNPVSFIQLNTVTGQDIIRQDSFDVLPEGIGLGVPGDLIDTSGFLWMAESDPATRLPGGSDAGISIANVSIKIEDTEDVLSWMKKNILQPLALAIVQTKEGKLSVINVANLRSVQDWTPITTDQLFIESGNVAPNIPQSFDSTRIFSALSYNFKQPMFLGFTTTTVNITPKDFQADFDSGYVIPARVFGGSYQQVGKKTQFSNLPVYDSDVLIDAGSRALKLYSNATSEIQIRMRDEDFYETVQLQETIAGSLSLKRNITRGMGTITQINIPNLITSNGSRDEIQFGFVKSIRREFQTNTSVITILLLTNQQIVANYLKTWTASGVIDTATSTVLQLNPQYTIGNDDTQGFAVGDQVQLFSAVFEPLSDPQEIDSILVNEITLVASFNGYGGGGPITATSGNIIKHASIDLQPISPFTRKSYLANFSDTAGDELDITVFGY